MNHAIFFNSVRSSAFNGKLIQPQVDGMEAILAEAKKEGLSAHHTANILAQVKRETGGYMSPIKETVMPYHTDKNPSDAIVKNRLDTAWAAGKLGNVKSPYWRDGWFGRGQIQISHKDNYDKVGQFIGVDLVGNPDLALDLPTSAKIAVVGMEHGLFTGKKLSDYKFPDALDAPVSKNPRRIVNGKDGSDKEVAQSHRQFYDALVNAGWDEAQAKPQTPSTPKRNRLDIIAEIEKLIAELKALGE